MRSSMVGLVSATPCSTAAAPAARTMLLLLLLLLLRALVAAEVGGSGGATPGRRGKPDPAACVHRPQLACRASTTGGQVMVSRVRQEFSR